MPTRGGAGRRWPFSPAHLEWRLFWAEAAPLQWWELTAGSVGVRCALSVLRLGMVLCVSSLTPEGPQLRRSPVNGVAGGRGWTDRWCPGAVSAQEPTAGSQVPS